MTTKILDESHYDLVLNLLKSRKKFSQQPITDEVWNVLSTGILKSLKNKRQHRIIGYVDTELRAVVSQSFHDEYPCWFMNFFASDKNYNLFSNGHGDYINQCLMSAMDDAESRKIYDIYYSVPIHYIRSSSRTHYSSPAWSRYDIYIDQVIPANTHPELTMYKYAYGKVLKSHDVAIKHAVLQQQFRRLL
jgi:hypothetical protein